MNSHLSVIPPHTATALRQPAPAAVTVSQAGSAHPLPLPPGWRPPRSALSPKGEAQPYLHLRGPQVLHGGWLAGPAHNEKLLPQGGCADRVDGEDLHGELPLPGEARAGAAVPRASPSFRNQPDHAELWLPQQDGQYGQGWKRLGEG